MGVKDTMRKLCKYGKKCRSVCPDEGKKPKEVEVLKDGSK